MKVSVKKILLLLPLLLWAAFFLFLELGQQRTEHYLYNSNTVKWGRGDQQLTAVIDKTNNANVESHQYVVSILDSQGNDVVNKDISIDWDMGGGGMVAFMQMDNDADMELVVARKGGIEASNYYLDYDGSGVRQKSLATTDGAVDQILQDWFFYNVPNPFLIGLLALLTIGYYVFFFPVAWLLKKLFRVS